MYCTGDECCEDLCGGEVREGRKGGRKEGRKKERNKKGKSKCHIMSYLKVAEVLFKHRIAQHVVC